MENITYYENSIGQEMVAIDNGDTLTCMTKVQYEELQAIKEQPLLGGN